MVKLKGKSSNQKQNALHVVSKFALRGGVELKGKSSNQKQNALYVVSKFALRGGVASRGIEPLLAGKANKPHVAYFFYFFKW